MTEQLPFVSICTPTFNRRPFIQSAIDCFKHQTYPQDRMEWIIIDDGGDKIEDIIKASGLSNIQYFSYDEKMTLGKKRNLMHSKAKGDIIVYMDDDDYYPAERVSHAVEKLQANPEILLAGSSIIHVYFKHIDNVIEFGPYGENHATAATFAFKRELLEQTSYNETQSMAEEKDFLKNHSIPMVQLDPKKTILVFSHSHNYFDKKELLTPENKSWKKTELKVDDFVKEPEVKKFFLETIETLLDDYDLGTLKHKPDVIENLNKIKEEKEKMIEMFKQLGTSMSLNINGKPVIMKNEEIVELINRLAKDNHNLQLQMKTAVELYPPLQLPITNQENKQVPTKYAQVFLQKILERSMIFEEILKHYNLRPEESKLPQMPSLYEVMPELAELNQQPKLDLTTIPTNDNNVNNEDIDTIMQQTECSREIALKFYKENNKDIVDSIMKIFELKESGDYEKIEKEAEEAAKNASKASETDIDLVIQQTECSPERAAQALDKNNQDIVEAIMEITNEQDEASKTEETTKTEEPLEEVNASSSA